MGCNPEDVKAKQNQGKFQEDASQSAEQSSEEHEPSDLNNFDKSQIGKLVHTTFNYYPPLMGFGIPQRTSSYIFGKEIGNK